jgi:hypothetical protein
MSEEHLEDLALVEDDGGLHRRDAPLVAAVHVRASRQQQRHQSEKKEKCFLLAKYIQ